MISRVNPLTYEVDALRALMVAGRDERIRHRGGPARPDRRERRLLMAVAARLYPRVVT